MNDKLELGCGKWVADGFDGLDLHPYENATYVHDLDADGPWPIEDNRYGYIRAIHLIEHVRDLRKFFAEIHRIAKNGATVYLMTPHYSCANSWADPTHVHHLSVAFCDPFLYGTLLEQFPKFKMTSRKITFGSFLLTWPAQLYCKLFGYTSYERHFTWIFPASSVIVELEVIK